jgi:hypothetical protein
MKKTIKDIVSKLGIMGDFFKFLLENKKWWLLPIIIVLFLFAVLIILAETSPVAPFVYTLF